MLCIDETFGSFHGHGYLLIGDKSSPMVGYKFVLRRDNFSGGGVILGLSEEDAFKAAELKNVLLSVGSDKFFELLVGYYDGNPLPAAVMGFAAAAGPDNVIHFAKQ
jgi:hypothetical protein